MIFRRTKRFAGKLKKMLEIRAFQNCTGKAEDIQAKFYKKLGTYNGYKVGIANQIQTNGGFIVTI